MRRFLNGIQYIVIASLCLAACRHQADLRFALLSDTHVSYYGSGAEDLRLAVQDINQDEDLDFVIVSGDITDMNTGDNLSLAKQILDSLNAPYHIIPGNHDTKWSGSGGDNFDTLWGADHFLFDGGGYRFIGFHQGPVLRMGDGHIPVETFAWLDSVLARTGPNVPIILVTHYELTDAVDNLDQCMDILKNYNIRAVLHGHGHRNRLMSYQGIPGIMGRSTLRGSYASGGYNVVEIRNDSMFVFEKVTGEEMSPAWVSISLREHHEIAAVPDSMALSEKDQVLEGQVHLEWVRDTGKTMTASPVICSDYVYVGNASGKMYCMEIHDGDVVWTSDLSGGILGTAAASELYVVCTSLDKSVYCMDARDGSVIWRYATNEPLVSVPVIGPGDVVYTGASDGVFRALNAANGELIWAFPGVGAYVETRPLVYRDLVIFGAWDAALYALNRMDGKATWIWRGPKDHPLYSPAACWPVAANDKIFIAAPDRVVTSIDAATGKTLWRSNGWKFRETIGISADGDFVFARSMTDSVVAFDSRSGSEHVIWAEDFEYGYDIAPSMPVESDGTLYWGTKNGLIYAADAKTGRSRWKYKFGNTVINTICPVDGRCVLFSNMDGFVGLLMERTSTAGDKLE
ncbi:MAG: PQQ-binding-like beta-propeller repeat protein [candidate division KSB1 bacterium]|jgi:outer membrane protein assembly factor BamB/predicted phosphodiesterase|nr:PQQ-binding-like beta-propeller repeat protein [candidate division KSB1 bacterium]